MIPRFVKLPVFSRTWWAYVAAVSVTVGVLTEWWFGMVTAVIIIVSEIVVDLSVRYAHGMIKRADDIIEKADKEEQS